MSESLCCPICESSDEFCKAHGCQDTAPIKKIYVISGNTFEIKEDLKAFGCVWDANRKAWLTKYICKSTVHFQRLESVVKAAGGHVCPLYLTGQVKTIQDILNK